MRILYVQKEASLESHWNCLLCSLSSWVHDQKFVPLFAFPPPPPPPPPHSSYTLPLICMVLIDSVVATMVIVTGPHPLRARTTSRPSTKGYIACSTNLSIICLEVRWVIHLSMRGLQHMNCCFLLQLNLTVHPNCTNMSQVYTSHILYLTGHWCVVLVYSHTTPTRQCIMLV